jgi:hypothetical protein
MPFNRWPCFLHLLGHRNGVGHAALKRIVGVHQQNAIVRPSLGKSAEGGALVRPTLNERVGHGTGRRKAEIPCRAHIAGAVETPDDGRPTGMVTPQALGPAQPEVNQQPLSGNLSDAAGLCGDKRLKIEDVEQQRLDDLGLDQRRLDAQHRPRGKYRIAFPG